MACIIGLIQEFNENKLKSLAFPTISVDEPEQSETGRKSPDQRGVTSCQERGLHIFSGFSIESLHHMKVSDSRVRLNFRIAIYHHFNIFKLVMMSREKPLMKRSKSGID